MKYLLLSAVLLPSVVSAHTGHEEEGVLAQFLSLEHVAANILGLLAFSVLAIMLAKKQYNKKAKSLNK